MKKLFKPVLAGLMAISLAACSNGGSSTPSAAPADEGDDKISIALCVNGTLGDKSFFDSGNEGMQWIERDFGDKAETEVIEFSYDDTTWQSKLENVFMSEEYDIIIVGTYDMLGMTVELTAEYPDQKVWFYDEQWDFETNPRDNVISLLFKQNEGSFLAGYIAAKLSKTGKVGAVGGQDSDTINDFIVGYEAGAKYANPDVTVEKQYANDFEDPAKGKECALALYNAGCDIVFQVAGKTGEGVFEAAAESGNLAIGVDGDQKYINPDVIICSMVKRVGKSIYDVVSKTDELYKPGQDWIADMATGYIDVVYGTDDMTQQVSDELKAEVEELKAKIISGEIVVPTALN